MCNSYNSYKKFSRVYEARIVTKALTNHTNHTKGLKILVSLGSLT